MSDPAAAIPRVSVVLPVRNGGAYLAPAIDSILTQTFTDFELIVVDDGSTDGTAAMLASISDPRLIVVAGPAAGIVAALNTGLARARADLIARMDADDIALPGRFAAQVAYLDANPAVAALGSAVILIDADGRDLEPVGYPQSPEAIRALEPHVHFMAHPTVMMRAAAVRAVGGYRAQFVAAEDADLWLRLGDTHDLANLAEPLLRYRTHAGQFSAVKRAEGRRAVALAAFLASERRAGRGEADCLRDNLSASCLASAMCVLSRPPLERRLPLKFLLALLEGASADAAARGRVAAILTGLGREALWRGRLRDLWRIERVRRRLRA